MRCQKCSNDFEEKNIQESHDIPKYIGGEDLDGRHQLCVKCHKRYEFLILQKCLEFVGEKIEEGEEILFWQIELKKQPKELKLHFQKIARKIKEEFFYGLQCG